MSIRYKLIIVISAVILLTALPISLFLISRQEREDLRDIIARGEAMSKILSQSAMNIVLMNEGNIISSRIDGKEIMEILKPYVEQGMVYADTVLLSSSRDLNGTVLASLGKGAVSRGTSVKEGKISTKELAELLSGTAYREITDPHGAGRYLEMVSIAKLPEGTPFTIGRIIFSREDVLAPLREIRTTVVMIIIALVLFVAAVGFVFATYISRPIEKLISGVEKIEAGELRHEVDITGTDELGRLGISFNRMAKILDMKISELESMNRRLTHLDAIKDEFLANTSHELRTPINGIVGIAESLLEGAAGKLGEAALHNLSMIVKSGRRLTSLVNDILDLSRLKNHDIELVRKPVDLHAVVQVALLIVAPQSKLKGIAVENLIRSGDYIINGDEDRLQQILLNLVDNAVKFTDHGSITISATASGNDSPIAVLMVKDTGIGIPANRREAVFDSFVQADGTIARRFGGTGLGLSITKKLVELHGGTITLESEQGKGTTFRVALPIFEGDAPTEEGYMSGCFGGEAAAKDYAISLAPVTPPVTPIEGRGAMGLILVVDDELVNLQVMINHLGLAGYEVRVVKSGRDALELLDGGLAPDLVLLDIMMPVMTGFEVCRRIRQTKSLHELPVIMLTAKNSPLDIVTGFETGANDYISKPFDRQELLARVNSFVELKKSAEKKRKLIEYQKELSVAREIQSSILPTSFPRVPGIDIAVKYQPINAVGGDFYDFHILEDGRLGVIIADVAGHGMPASLIGAMLKIAFSMNNRHAGRPEEFLSSINRELCKHSNNHFITANYLLLDPATGGIVSSNAGHWHLPLLNRKTGDIRFIYNRSRPMGIYPNLGFSRFETTAEPGSRLLLFTDGIIEARNAAGELFGEKRFHTVLKDTRALPPDDCVAAIAATADEWSGLGRSFDDDVCLICLDI